MDMPSGLRCGLITIREIYRSPAMKVIKTNTMPQKFAGQEVLCFWFLERPLSPSARKLSMASIQNIF